MRNCFLLINNIVLYILGHQINALYGSVYLKAFLTKNEESDILGREKTIKLSGQSFGYFKLHLKKKESHQSRTCAFRQVMHAYAYQGHDL